MTELPEVTIPEPAEAPPKTSRLAIASLVLGILGFCLLPIVGGIIGLVLGILGLVKISNSQGRLAGQGIAIAGTVVSGLTFLVLPILIAILIPAIWGGLQLARSAASANIRQLCKATQAYAASHNQQLPPAANWDQTLLNAGLVGNGAVLADPSDPPGTRSYAMNAAVNGLTTQQIPSQAVLFFECAPGSPPGGGKELLPPKPRHRGGYNIGFADGHVQAVPPEDVDSLIWNPRATAPPQ